MLHDLWSILITWLYLKMFPGPTWLSVDVIYCLLPSKTNTSSSFNSISYVEVKILRGVYIPPLNHVCIQSSGYEGLSHSQIFKNIQKWLKSRMKLIFRALFFINEFHLKITRPDRFFSCKILCILFPNWIL